MNVLLIFFAIPIAIIILSAILETCIKSPCKVAGIFFSIFLILAFVFGGTAELLVAVIIYTILAFIVAFIVCIIMNSPNRDCFRDCLISSCRERNCGCDLDDCNRRNRCRNREEEDDDDCNECNRRNRDCERDRNRRNRFENRDINNFYYSSGTLSLGNNNTSCRCNNRCR